MSCDNDARAPNLGAKANSGKKKHIQLFAGLKEETLLQISSPHRDSIPEQSHSKVISGWIGHWVSLDCSLLIQSLAHGCHSIISKAKMRNGRARGVILQLCFLTCLLPVNGHSNDEGHHQALPALWQQMPLGTETLVAYREIWNKVNK